MKGVLCAFLLISILLGGCSSPPDLPSREDNGGRLSVRIADCDTDHDGTNDFKLIQTHRGNRVILEEMVNHGKTNFVFSIGDDCQFVECDGTNLSFFAYGHDRIIFDEFTRDTTGHVSPVSEQEYNRKIQQLRAKFVPGKSPF